MEQSKGHGILPRDGSKNTIGTFANRGVLVLILPAEPAEGNDWVLVLESLEDKPQEFNP